MAKLHVLLLQLLRRESETYSIQCACVSKNRIFFLVSHRLSTRKKDEEEEEEKAIVNDCICKNK